MQRLGFVSHLHERMLDHVADGYAVVFSPACSQINREICRVHRAPPPKSWRWEIYRAGKTSPQNPSPGLRRDLLPPNTIIAIKPGVILPYAEADRSAMQGSSVAQSADGSTAIAGALANNRVIGAAWVHTRSDGVWTETHLGF